MFTSTLNKKKKSLTFNEVKAETLVNQSALIYRFIRVILYLLSTAA